MVSQITTGGLAGQGREWGRADDGVDSDGEGGNMTKEEIEKAEKDHLGDGVYAIYDGNGIWLHANNHLNPTDRIYLGPSVLAALNRFVERVGVTS